jgi:hypothetical protein
MHSFLLAGLRACVASGTELAPEFFRADIAKVQTLAIEADAPGQNGKGLTS